MIGFTLSYSENLDLTINASTIENVEATSGNGGIIYLPSNSSNSSVYVKSSTISSCTAGNSGALFDLEGLVVVMNFTDSTISYLYAGTSSPATGGLAYVSAISSTLNLTSTTISSVNIYGSGGCFYFNSDSQSIVVSSSSIDTVSVDESGSVFYADYTTVSFDLTISDSNLTNILSE